MSGALHARPALHARQLRKRPPGRELVLFLAFSDTDQGFISPLSGDWMTLSPRSSLYMKGTKVTGRFLRTALPHATATNDSYAYFMLPGKTAAETTAFAANPSVKILANTPTLHAASGKLRFQVAR